MRRVSAHAPVAQWIEHQTSDLRVGSSSLSGRALLSSPGNNTIVLRVTLDASGGRHQATLIDAQGLTGLALTSGTAYQVSGPGHNTFNDDDLTPPVRERTSYDVIHVVGPGDATDLLVRAGFHLAFNSNGDLVAFTAVDSGKCK